MGTLDWYGLEPATFVMLWAAASNFLTTGEGGRFRWGNIYGNSAIIMAGAICNSLNYTLKAKREASIMGMSAGIMTMVFPTIGLVRWGRMVPAHISTAFGGILTGYYGYQYYQVTMAVEDAGEDF